MSKQEFNTERCFISDSIASKIISTFYEPKKPIPFSFQTIIKILGINSNSARRVLSELYYAKCITKFGYHHSRQYIITPQNAQQFSWNVANSHKEINKIVHLKRNNQRSMYKNWKIRKKKQNELRKEKTAILTDQCMACKLWFNWNGLRVHRNKCYKKPLSFADPIFNRS